MLTGRAGDDLPKEGSEQMKALSDPHLQSLVTEPCVWVLILLVHYKEGRKILIMVSSCMIRNR